jgi:hypothetical protein
MRRGGMYRGLCPLLLWLSATSTSSRTVLAALDYALTTVLVAGVVARTALAVAAAAVVVVGMVMVMVMVVVVVVVVDSGGGGGGGGVREGMSWSWS